jgi:hypothetical protein
MPSIPPPVVIEANAAPAKLAGWPEFDLWMRCNEARYAALREIAHRVNLSEVDALRLLLWSMADAKANATNQLTDLIRAHGLPCLPIVIDPADVMASLVVEVDGRPMPHTGMPVPLTVNGTN